MVSEQTNRRMHGITRPWHVVVLLVCLVLLLLLLVGIRVSMIRTNAIGEAQDLMYDTMAYLLDCNTGKTAFQANLQDDTAYYITTPAILAPYHKGEIKGNFYVVVGKDMRALYASSTHTEIWFNRYQLSATGVFPKDQAPSGFKFQKIESKPNTKEEGRE